MELKVVDGERKLKNMLKPDPTMTKNIPMIQTRIVRAVNWRLNRPSAEKDH